LNETQTLSPSIEEDWFELNVEIDHNWELRWWVLSNGKFIIIQEPKQFRDEIADHFFIGSKQYT
ncbi:MAG: WYL domain-containing protein, partial [Burkholderiaceae bacterium]